MGAIYNFMYNYNCKHCGLFFENKNKKAKFCSQICYKENSKKGIQKKCLFCNKEAYAARYKLKKSMFFCSFHCNMEWQKSRRPTRVCCFCKKEFKKKSRNDAKYCSIYCKLNSPENIEQLSKMRKGQASRKINKLEKLGYKMLEELGLKYEPQYILERYVVDAFILDYNLIVQFDGDYWHANPLKYSTLSERQINQKKIDDSQVELANKMGIKTIRIWEHDMHKNYADVKKNILNIIKEQN